MASRSNGKSAAGQCAAAERHHVYSRAGLLQPLEIAREHFEIREQIVRPQNRLRAAHVSVAGNHCVGIALGAASNASMSPPRNPARAIDLVAQPQADIERDLLIAAAAGVDLVGEPTDPLPQLTNDQGVDVFVGRAAKNSGLRASSRIASNAATSRARSADVGYPRSSSARANACEPRMSASISLRSKCERTGKPLEDFRGTFLEPSAPEFHFASSSTCSSTAFMTAARTWIGSPIRLMNPRASF